MPSPDETLWYDYNEPGTTDDYVVMIVAGSFTSGNKPVGCVDVYVVGSNPKRVFGGVNAMADLRNGRPPGTGGPVKSTGSFSPTGFGRVIGKLLFGGRPRGPSNGASTG